MSRYKDESNYRYGFLEEFRIESKGAEKQLADDLCVIDPVTLKNRNVVAIVTSSQFHDKGRQNDLCVISGFCNPHPESQEGTIIMTGKINSSGSFDLKGEFRELDGESDYIECGM